MAETADRLNAAAALLDGGKAAGATAAACSDGRMSFAGLNHAANKAGWALRDAGCTPGDRVIVALPDSVDCLAAMLGVWKVGAIVVPVGVDLTAADVAGYVSDVRATVAVVHP